MKPLVYSKHSHLPELFVLSDYFSVIFQLKVREQSHGMSLFTISHTCLCLGGQGQPT